jgi:hypothetical protein
VFQSINSGEFTLDDDLEIQISREEKQSRAHQPRSVPPEEGALNSGDDTKVENTPNAKCTPKSKFEWSLSPRVSQQRLDMFEVFRHNYGWSMLAIAASG